MAKENGSKEKKTVSDLVGRNVSAILAMRRQHESRMTFQDKLIGLVTRFTGSIYFIYSHLILVTGWVIINSRSHSSSFDPFPFPMLAIFASIETIFLTSVVLISTRRASALNEKSADLNLQVNLLAEHEITRLIQLVDALCKHSGVTLDKGRESEHLKEEIAPEFVLKKIEEAESMAEPVPEPLK